MKPLYPIRPNMEINMLKPIPATIKDMSSESSNDVLYTMYSLKSFIENQKIKVEFMVSDLVSHSRVDGEDAKYWVGIGIQKNLTNDATIFAGYGVPVLSELNEPAKDVGSQIDKNLVEYSTIYFDVEEAIRFQNQGYVVVRKEDGVDYYYELDFSYITRKTSNETGGSLNWNGISIDKIKNEYLFGIDLTDSNGNPLPDSMFIHYLNAAIDYLQNLLDIIIVPTEIKAERHDYIRNDYQNWGFIQLNNNPIREIKAVRLMYGTRTAIEIPLDWVQCNKLTGQITLFPSAGSASNLIIGQTGLLMGLQSQWSYAPQMWEIDYIAGLDEKDKTMPLELMREAINKRAACGILNVWGDLIIGAGIASQSVSIDGISQSIGTTQSAMYGGASARIESYTKDLKENILPALIKKFTGIKMVVV